MDLPQQEGRERVARLVQVVPGRVEPRGAEAVEGKIARRGATGPAAGREVVMAELEARFDRVTSLHPRDVARELPPVVLLEAEPRPSLSPIGV